MKHINQLIEVESKLLRNVLAAEVEPEIASEATNAAGKIIAACKVQIDYAEHHGKRVKIPFLETGLAKKRKK